jgi:exopolysaccharide biosynthesis polyprenyl glycosylphosphotransferase
MKSNASLIYNVGLVIGDFLALVAAFVGAFAIRSASSVPVAHPIPLHTYVEAFLTLLPFWILIFALLGLYSSDIYEKRFSELGRLFVGSFIGLTFIIFWNFVHVKPIFPAKLVPVYGFVLAFLFLVIFRSLARFIRGQLFSVEVGLSRVLIVGNTHKSLELIDSLIDSRRSGYRIVGIVGAQTAIGNYRLPLYDNFRHFLEKHPDPSLHGIVQTELYADENKNAEILTYAQEHHVTYRFVPGNTELFVGNVNVELFRGSTPVITVRQTALFGWGRIVKRVFDLTIGSLLIVITSPIMLLVAIAVKLSDGGPVFLRQTRLTRFNKEFRVFKFRSNNIAYNGLTPDEAFAKMKRPDLLAEFRANGNFLPDDPRNTHVGRFIRSTSLDELPQLFNVFRGELSLVGPRALIPSDLARYNKRHTILSVKSGITGLAQVSGRNNIPVDERRKLDLYYAQNWSFWLDIIIMLKTFRVIFSHEYDGK